LLAVAHSTCGHEAGIACIIGTGSNSCFYDGREIVRNISPLGFILGDEGGGATLGRILVSDVLKGILSKPLQDAFFERFGLTQADILDHVYKKPFPNRFLASLSPFLYDHLDEPEIRLIVANSFNSFLTRNVMQYDYTEYAANFAGSVACHYQEILRETAETVGVRVGKITKNPIRGLVDFYNSFIDGL
jgi:N-acetylglucosamine kinase-like BadF-type ATPase